MKIKVLGYEYEVIRSDPSMWSGTGLGRSDILNGKIQLRDSLPIDVQHSTLIHEVVHQISDILDLGLDHDDKENMVSGVTAGVFSFIRDNPQVIAAILNREDVC